MGSEELKKEYEALYNTPPEHVANATVDRKYIEKYAAIAKKECKRCGHKFGKHTGQNSDGSFKYNCNDRLVVGIGLCDCLEFASDNLDIFEQEAKLKGLTK